jgi:hypothetical protein
VPPAAGSLHVFKQLSGLRADVVKAASSRLTCQQITQAVSHLLAKEGVTNMDNQTLLVQLVSALAWPLTVIIVALMFRQEIRKVASRLSTLSYGDMKAEFEKDLNKLEREVKELPIKESATKVEHKKSDAETLDSYERLSRIAEISPRAAIMEAWRDIEVTTKQVTDAYGISTDGHIAGVRAIRELVRQHLLPESVVKVYEQMRGLRARAAHAPDFTITADEAKRYIDTAYRFHNALLFLLQQAEKPSFPKKGG